MERGIDEDQELRAGALVERFELFVELLRLRGGEEVRAVVVDPLRRLRRDVERGQARGDEQEENGEAARPQRGPPYFGAVPDVVVPKSTVGAWFAAGFVTWK